MNTGTDRFQSVHTAHGQRGAPGARAAGTAHGQHSPGAATGASFRDGDCEGVAGSTSRTGLSVEVAEKGVPEHPMANSLAPVLSMAALLCRGPSQVLPLPVIMVLRRRGPPHWWSSQAPRQAMKPASVAHAKGIAADRSAVLWQFPDCRCVSSASVYTPIVTRESL